MAQETRWVDQDSFAIGRWDGTLTLFRLPDAPRGAPVIESAAITPAWVGVQMITPLDANVFATSNDSSSIIIWEMDRISSAPGSELPNAGATLLTRRAVLHYDQAFGVATNGAEMRLDGRQYFASGHESGHLLIWRAVDGVEAYALERVVDIRSPTPVPSPYPLRHVRGVVDWHNGVVVTAAEDGDLCLVNVRSGVVLARVRYNTAAQRGVNDVALLGNLLLVANCSVGDDDQNLWLFRLAPPDRILPVTSINLRRDASRKQVFNFSVELASRPNGVVFFAATEEGLLWMGDIQSDRFHVIGHEAVSTRYGATVTLDRTANMLAVVGDNVHLFQLP
ncbi:MAG: hypothetical protein ACREL3_12795 [Gemmatimonadales bacterium]